MAAAFQSLLLGKRLPESLAFCAFLDLHGLCYSRSLNKAGLQAARDSGITEIVYSR